jgi:hypothetical protein
VVGRERMGLDDGIINIELGVLWFDTSLRWVKGKAICGSKREELRGRWEGLLDDCMIMIFYVCKWVYRLMDDWAS